MLESLLRLQMEEYKLFEQGAMKDINLCTRNQLFLINKDRVEIAGFVRC